MSPVPAADRSAAILDIGCGSGSFLNALRVVGYTNLEGVDLSPAQVDAGRRRGLNGITLASAMDYLGARPGRYALVTAFNILEHQTRAELFALLDVIHAGLLPGGRLIAIVPNAKGLFGANVRSPISLMNELTLRRWHRSARSRIRERGVMEHGRSSTVSSARALVCGSSFAGHSWGRGSRGRRLAAAHFHPGPRLRRAQTRRVSTVDRRAAPPRLGNGPKPQHDAIARELVTALSTSKASTVPSTWRPGAVRTRGVSTIHWRGGSIARGRAT